MMADLEVSLSEILLFGETMCSSNVTQYVVSVNVQFYQQQKARGSSGSEPQQTVETPVYCVPWVEACALVTLCSHRPMTLRLSLMLLREVRSLHEALTSESNWVRDLIETYMYMYVVRYVPIKMSGSHWEESYVYSAQFFLLYIHVCIIYIHTYVRRCNYVYMPWKVAVK